MKKTICGVGLALTMAFSGCSPTTDGRTANPQATTSTSRSETANDAARANQPDDGQAGTVSPDMAERNKDFNENENPAGTDAGSKALEGNVAEQQLAALALLHAENNQVREVAKMLANDHQEAEAELRKVAGTSLPVLNLSAEHEKTKATLEELNGPAFDKAYIDAMVFNHEKMLAFYEAQATQAPTQPLKDHFARRAPVIKKHLDHCKKVQSNFS